MLEEKWKILVQDFDERRDIVIPGNQTETIQYCVEQFIEIAQNCIESQGYFAVALSGGSTPKAVYQILASPENRQKIKWDKVLLFWSDERNVPPEDKESNYHMAMEAGFASLPLKRENIFRMKAEDRIEEHALEYETLIQTRIPKKIFDVVLLGMGEDGHTASLFPMTHGLKVQNRLAIGNFVPQKNTWRMTLTYDCINSAGHILLYVLGKSKKEMVVKVLTGPYDPNIIPAQKVGTPTHRALWIMDEDASELLAD
jgi:6-phosphogluconolactonase